MLHELGAEATLAAASRNSRTPAHLAAQNRHEGCLRVLHALGTEATLAAVSSNSRTPAHIAAQNGHEGCLRVLHELGRGRRGHPRSRFVNYPNPRAHRC